jgi:HTH-type transcriptional regulator/antitoxin HigA
MLTTTRGIGRMTLTINKDVYGALLAQAQPQLITNEEENEKALEIVERLMASKSRTPEEDQLLQLLVALIERFEDEHYQLNISTPHSMLLYFMEIRNLKQSDLVGVIGSKGVVSEVVNAKRSISKSQAKALGKFFSVSPSLFI